MKKKIVIAGGHLTPAMAVVHELQKRGNWEIFYFGRPYSTEGDRTLSLESKIAKEQGIKFVPINFGRIQHNFTRYSPWAFLRIPWGFILSFIQLIRLRPSLVLSFGSYVGVTVVISAWVLGIPIVIHEQTTVVGLANKISSSLAKKILISWPQTLKIFSQEKTVLTGNPIRSEIFQFNPKVWESFEFDSKVLLVLITGGNQGSHRINVAVEGVLKKLLGKYNLLHQTGHLESFGDFKRLSQTKEKLLADLKKRYQIRKYLTGEEWGTVLKKADLVVSRAGINTISELLALKKPQLLIPIPWLPADEQGQNARMVKKMGLGEILAQKDLNPENLFQEIENMIKNLNKYQQKPEQVNLQAAGKIVDELEKMA